MQLSDVIALIGAGYSKADIEAMEAQDQVDGLLETKQEAPAAVQPDPATPESAPQPDYSELLSAIRDLKAAVQHNNVVNTPQPAGIVPADVHEEADKLLTTFCNT